jgi:hypothetical protein
MAQSYYSVYGGTTAQFPMYGTGPGGMMTGAAAAASFYPYLQFGEGSGTGAATGYSSGQGYGVNYPHQLFQYPAINSTGGYPQHYGAPMSLAPTPALQSGLYIIKQLLLLGLVLIIIFLKIYIWSSIIHITKKK